MAAAKFVLAVQDQASVHLPVRVLQSHVLAELVGLQLHEGSLDRFLERQERPLHEGMQQHQVCLVVLRRDYLHRMDVAWLQGKGTPSFVQRLEYYAQFLPEVLAVNRLKEVCKLSLSLEILSQQSSKDWESVAISIENVLIGRLQRRVGFNSHIFALPFGLVEVYVEEVVEVGAVEASEKDERTADEASAVPPSGSRLVES